MAEAAKTEEQIAKEREAVDAMRNAKANMAGALDRIQTLENALRAASVSLGVLKGYIAPNVYTYPVDNNRRRCIDVADDAITAVARVLG